MSLLALSLGESITICVKVLLFVGLAIERNPSHPVGAPFHHLRPIIQLHCYLAMPGWYFPRHLIQSLLISRCGLEAENDQLYGVA